MEKIDLRKQYKYLYAPSAKKVQVVDVPPLQFAMIDGVIQAGEGVGDSPDFQEAVSALYSISYTLKFMFKKRDEDPIDYPVMALEGLWGTLSGAFVFGRRETWLYTAMIMQPDIITPEVFAEGVAQARKRKAEPGLDRLRHNVIAGNGQPASRRRDDSSNRAKGGRLACTIGTNQP